MRGLRRGLTGAEGKRPTDRQTRWHAAHSQTASRQPDSEAARVWRGGQAMREGAQQRALEQPLLYLTWAPSSQQLALALLPPLPPQPPPTTHPAAQ
jgi:hypothetical protein